MSACDGKDLVAALAASTRDLPSSISILKAK